jgi:hypothetical protein
MKDATVTDEDGRRIARQWNREIEEQERRLDKDKDDGRGTLIVWMLLWLVWLAALVVFVSWVSSLH